MSSDGRGHLTRCPCCGKRLDGKTQDQIATDQRDAIERFLAKESDQ
jgi:hypothetical protein